MAPVVIVLAGGASNRLWPLRDKLFVEFGAMSLMERHLRALQAAGFSRCIVVSRPDTVDRVREIGATVGLNELGIAVQAEPLGMADAVLSARTNLEALGDGSVYITQAHDVFDPELHRRMLDRWEHRPAVVKGLVAASRVAAYFPGGYLTLDGERVTGVIEKPGAGHEPSGLVNLVAHIYDSSTALLESLAKESAAPGPDDAYERAVSCLMQAGEFRALTYEGRWQALKYPWHLLDVMDLLLDRWTSGIESPGTGYEQREDGVFVGRDVRIYPGSHVVAPALLGHGSIVGHNALVRGSILGQGAVAGFGSEVARSYLADGVELHHNYVGDSVMDKGSAIGYGGVTANYRLDGRTVPMFAAAERIDTGRMKLGAIIGAGARLGVNSSTMPGVKVGAGAIIGPNLRVTRDVPDGARVLDEKDYGHF